MPSAIDQAFFVSVAVGFLVARLGLAGGLLDASVAATAFAGRFDAAFLAGALAAVGAGSALFGAAGAGGVTELPGAIELAASDA
ncbi:hypothetical protein BAL199_25129 [alpha proteobacterium BAL199]|nr:hypothetical protein BAL199_25129 [alpha proteobacterium BAL199]